MTGARLFVTALTMTAVLAVSSLAQEPATKKTTEKTEKPATPIAPKKKGDPSRRVPDYFGQIGLTPAQKDTIYQVRKKHQETIDGLRKQISESESKSLAECEAVLTETQKKLLENLRSNGTRPAPKAATSK
jgi:Spy/CpxP family protein refolding chaperone